MRSPAATQAAAAKNAIDPTIVALTTGIARGYIDYNRKNSS